MCGESNTLVGFDESLDEWDLYRGICSEGKLYEYVNKHISLTAKNSKLVKSAKKLVLTVLFSENEEDRAYFRANKGFFSDLFPSIFELFELIKCKDHTQLSILLQNIESEVFLNRIAARIKKENSLIPIFTVHDSICTTLEHESVVKEIMESEIEQAIGVKPHLKVEYWR